MLAYTDVAGRLDKIKMIGASRGLFPYSSTIWQDDMHGAYFDSHTAAPQPRGADVSEDAQRAIKTAIGLSTKLEPELHIIYVGPELIYTKVAVQKQYY
jgi:hypothetical protein